MSMILWAFSRSKKQKNNQNILIPNVKKNGYRIALQLINMIPVLLCENMLYAYTNNKEAEAAEEIRCVFDDI